MKRPFYMINWEQIVANLKVQVWKAKAESLQRDAYRFLDAWTAWTERYDCVLQANDGCDKCSLEDWGLDWCPFHDSASEMIK